MRLFLRKQEDTSLKTMSSVSRPVQTSLSKVRIALSSRSRTREESALVIGNPSFDLARFPLLPDLPAAAREAESVAGLYGTAPLIGVNAEANRVKARMPEADVIHFAGHYVADERSPLLSKLLLAKAARIRMEF